MGYSLEIARGISFITPWALSLSILVVICAAVVDIHKKKFNWSRYALTIFGVSVVLLIIQIILVYQIANNILDVP